jgi:hypothetical protein
VDIVNDNGKIQMEHLSSREFNTSIYSPSCAELLKGFHYENKEFFQSSIDYPAISGTDTAKVRFPWVYLE